MARAGIRIPIKAKIFLLFAVLITAALAVILTRNSAIFTEDKTAFVRELNARLASSTAKNFASRLATLQDKLVVFISSRESLVHTGAKVEDQNRVLFGRYQEFLGIGLLQDGAALKSEWFVRNPEGEAKVWPQDFESKLIESLGSMDRGADGRVLWRAQAPDGQWIFVFAFNVQVKDPKQNQTSSSASRSAWIAGVLPSTAFDDLLSDYSTGLNTGFVVDGEGFAIAASDAKVRRVSVTRHTLVKDYLQKTKASTTGDYSDLDDRLVVGSFEAVPKINLGVMVTTPHDKAFEAAQVLTHNMILIGLLALIVSISAAILMANYLTAPLQKLAAAAQSVGTGDFNVSVSATSNDEIGDLAGSFQQMAKGLKERDDALASAQAALVQSEKMSAFGQISAGIAHEVKNPLAGILGHAQLAMGKIQNEDLRRHLEVIEKETRRCKAIVENLMKFARAEKAELQPTDLAQVVQDTINLVDHQLSLAGCKILKDLQPCPIVLANGNQLQQVLLNLMVNASHAMEKAAVKNVTVRVKQAGNKAQIQIEDTGTGIPPEVQKKIFEPFFTTKPAGKGTGLGLSVSIGIVKDHKGEIYLKSEINRGTTFFIDIPIPDEAALKAAKDSGKDGAPHSTSSSKAPASAPAPAAPAPEHKTPPPQASPAAAPKPTPSPAPAAQVSAPPPIPASAATAGPFSMPSAPNQNANVTPISSFEVKSTSKDLLKGGSLRGPRKAAAGASLTPPPLPNETSEDKIFATSPGQSLEPTITKSAAAPTPKLGGKDPVTVTSVSLPEDPKEDFGFMELTNKGKSFDEAKAAGATATAEKASNPPPEPKLKDAAYDREDNAPSEFTVKIRRPKLKA